MKRTIKLTVIKAVALENVNGVVQSRDLKDVNYTGRKLTDVGMEKLFKGQLEKGERVFITSSEEIEKTYEMDIETFLAHAKLVE